MTLNKNEYGCIRVGLEKKQNRIYKDAQILFVYPLRNA